MFLFNNEKKINWLTKCIKNERRKLYRFDIKDYIKKLISELYIPSWKSLLTVIFLVALFFFLSHFGGILSFFQISHNILPFWKVPVLLQEDNHYQNLIAIHAGIGTIIFALIIFVAESLRDDKTDRARVLLRKSFLFPLVLAEILTFFIFIWGYLDFWSILPVFIIGIATIVSLWRLIAVLMNRYKLSQERARVLVDRLSQSIDLALDERIGNNILLSKLNANDIKLEFYPFSVDNESDYYCFKAGRFGVISDINIGILKEIAEIIDREGRDNGYSWEDTKGEIEAKEEGETKELKAKALPKNKQRYLIKKFHDIVDEEHNILLCVSKKLLKDEKKIDELNSLVKHAFSIKPIDNFAEEVRYDISGVKDQFITAIENKQAGKVEELVALYIKLAEGFLEQITKLGGGYSFELAKKERHSLFSGWEQVKWLSSDIRILFKRAMQSHNREIISDIAYLPIAIARRAIEKQDHYLFQEFIGFAELIYSFALKEKDEELRKFLIDRSWRYVKEISDIYVERRLRKDVLEKEEIEQMKGFAIYFLFIFQSLLKEAIDRNDLDSFNKFKETTLKLFDHFKPSESRLNSEDIKLRIEIKGLTVEQREEFTKLLRRQKILEETEAEINRRREQMLFGLASWTLNKFLKAQHVTGLKQFYQSIRAVFSMELAQFTDIFLETHDFDVEDYWGWTWWGLKADGEIHETQILEKLEKFYAVNALTLIENLQDEKITEIKLPHNRDLAYLVGGSRDLMKVLEDIQNTPDNWKAVLSDNAISKVGKFKELLSLTKETQEKEELEFKKTNNISQKKIQEFKGEVTKGFYESVILRNIFSHYKLFENQMHKTYTDKKTRFGISIVEDKAAFFEDWYVHFGDWGLGYGRDLASGEDSHLLDEIIKDCNEIQYQDEDFESVLRKFDNPEGIIVLATNTILWRFFENTKNFKPHWQEGVKQLKIRGFGGWYEFNGLSIPVFETYHSNIEDQVVVLHRDKLGQLVQLSPLNKDDDAKLINDIFYINVKAFSEDESLANKYIANPPEWLKKIGDEQKQREHLKEFALIQILERFMYKKLTDFEGYRLSLKKQ